MVIALARHFVRELGQAGQAFSMPATWWRMSLCPFSPTSINAKWFCPFLSVGKRTPNFLTMEKQALYCEPGLNVYGNKQLKFVTSPVRQSLWRGMAARSLIVSLFLSTRGRSDLLVPGSGSHTKGQQGRGSLPAKFRG